MKTIKMLFIVLVSFLLCASIIFTMPKVKADVTGTRFFYTSASDGYVTGFSSSYSTARGLSSGTSMDTTGYTFSFVGQYYDSFPFYRVHRAFLFFDTSIIPDDAVITKATLELYIVNDQTGAGDFNITIQTGNYTHPTDPLTLAEYNLNYYSGNGGSRNTSEISSLSDWNITLNSDGVSWINKTGQTKFALRSSQDIAGFAPSGYEWVQIGVAEWTEEQRPKLYVEYTSATGDPPTNDYLALDLSGASYKDAKTLLTAKQDYKFVYKVSDVNSVTDINYAQIHLDPAGKNVILRATHGLGDSWTFSEQSDPSNYVTLNVGACTDSTSGNQKTFTFYVKINWNWGSSTENIVVRGYVIDNEAQSDQDDYSNIFGVEATLTSSSPSVDDYHVNPSQTLTFSGLWYYTGTSIYPPDGDYQVKILLSGAQKGSTDTTLVSGAFAINANAENGVSSYNYKVSASYASTQGSFSPVIVDIVNVNIASNSTSPEAGETISSIVTATYAYSGTPVPTPTINILRNSTHYATGNFTDMLAGEGRYSYTVEDVSEPTYDLTAFSTNTLTVIWEGFQIEIDQISLPQIRVNVSSTLTSYWHCRFGNNQSSVPVGMLYVNGTNFNINSTGWAAVTFNFDTVGARILTTTAVNVNEVTDYNQIVGNPTVIWETLQILGYEVDLSTDKVYIRMIFESDGTQVSGGTISYANIIQTTNVTGWAIFNFQTASQVAHALTSYPVVGGVVTVSSQNQTVNFVKITYAPFVLRSYNAITNQTWNSGTGWLVFNGSGTIIIDVGVYGIPTRVTVNGATYYDWSYSAQKLTINNVASTVGVYWEQPPTPTPPPTTEVGAVPTQYTVTIIVAYGASPVQGALVTLGTSSVITDSSGVAVFLVAGGTYPVTVTGILITHYASQITVLGDSTFLIDLAQPQLSPTVVTMPTPPSPAPSLIDIIRANWFVIAIAIGIFVIGLIILWKKQ